MRSVAVAYILTLYRCTRAGAITMANSALATASTEMPRGRLHLVLTLRRCAVYA